MDDDISIRFPDARPPYRKTAVTFGGDHVLDLEFGEGPVLRSITVIRPTRHLPAASALGKAGGYQLVHDDQKDCLCIEFRAGAAGRSESLHGDAVDIDGEPLLRLLWGNAAELEGIIVWKASRWLPKPAPEPNSLPGASYTLNGDALSLKLFEGESVPNELHGGTTRFPSGLEVALNLDPEGRLQLAVVFDASTWLPAHISEPSSTNLGAWPVAGKQDTVFLELVAGSVNRVVSTDGVVVEGFEIHAAYDSSGRLLGFIVPSASRCLPPPFDRFRTGSD